jgi:hypothetical protein
VAPRRGVVGYLALKREGYSLPLPIGQDETIISSCTLKVAPERVLLNALTTPLILHILYLFPLPSPNHFTLKMNAATSSEKFVSYRITTRHHSS